MNTEPSKNPALPTPQVKTLRLKSTRLATSLPFCLLALGLTACASVPGPASPAVGSGDTAPETITQASTESDRDAAEAAASEEADPTAGEPAGETPPTWTHVPHPGFDAIHAADDPRERDRLAILAMAGEYEVDFDFTETVALEAGYERREPKESGGFETVIVVEDSPERIVLQHILVGRGGFVTKHWRQDWVFEAPERFEFVADQTWRTEPLADDVTAGAWTQCVFEVSDAPRYCGTGKWNHRYGVSTWTSDRSWRPLPRREFTQRNDYNALNVENRHTITPQGWTHEQDNTKVRREGEETVATLVREFGFNDYRNISGYDFSPAYDYWNETADYWALVRDAWEERLAAGTTLRLNTPVDGMVIIAGTFDQARKAAETSESEERENIAKLLDQWTSVATDQLADRR